MFFHSQTQFIETFKKIHRETFNFKGNRAILFHKDDDIPIAELKHCIALSLTYYRIKHLPILGTQPIP